MKIAILLAVLATFGFEGTSSAEPKGAAMGIQVCTAPNNCKAEDTAIVIDYRWTGCKDPKACTNIPSATDYSAWGVTFTNNGLSMNHSPSSGARLFMTAGVNGNSYRRFDLLNKEFSFDVDMSTIGCGLNAAVYLIAMEMDGGKASQGYVGAGYGTGYCDAQPAQEGRPSCHEFDIWEANSLATVYTSHPCNSDGSQCDGGGCGINAYGRGNKNYYGRGSGNQVDTTQPFTVITRFNTTDGTDSGALKSIQQQFKQNGRLIPVPTFDGYDAISDSFCGQNNFGGVSVGMSEGFKKGMVLSFSLWGDSKNPNGMNWLDNEPNGPCPNAYQNTNSPTVRFSNIKIGPIGSTN